MKIAYLMCKGHLLLIIKKNYEMTPRKSHFRNLTALWWLLVCHCWCCERRRHSEGECHCSPIWHRASHSARTRGGTDLQNSVPELKWGIGEEEKKGEKERERRNKTIQTREAELMWLVSEISHFPCSLLKGSWPTLGLDWGTGVACFCALLLAVWRNPYNIVSAQIDCE